MGIREISSGLRKTLLQAENMSLSLYEEKIAVDIDGWYNRLKADGEDYVLLITEKSGDIAMALIGKDKNIYVNEEARAQLSKMWGKNFTKEVKFLIPRIADDIDGYIVSVIGITVQITSKRLKAIGMGQRVKP